MFLKWIQTALNSRKFQAAFVVVAGFWVSYFQNIMTLKEAIFSSAATILTWIIAQAQVDAAEKRNPPNAGPSTRAEAGL